MLYAVEKHFGHKSEKYNSLVNEFYNKLPSNVYFEGSFYN